MTRSRKPRRNFRAPPHSMWRAVVLGLAFVAARSFPGDPLNYRQRKADWLGRAPLPPAPISIGRRIVALALYLAGAVVLMWSADAQIPELFWPAAALFVAAILVFPYQRY